MRRNEKIRAARHRDSVPLACSIFANWFAAGARDATRFAVSDPHVSTQKNAR
jgi:hypothetical protein